MKKFQMKMSIKDGQIQRVFPIPTPIVNSLPNSTTTRAPADLINTTPMADRDRDNRRRTCQPPQGRGRQTQQRQRQPQQQVGFSRVLTTKNNKIPTFPEAEPTTTAQRKTTTIRTRRAARIRSSTTITRNTPATCTTPHKISTGPRRRRWTRRRRKPRTTGATRIITSGNDRSAALVQK